MKVAECTAFLDGGQPCGRLDMCTVVTVKAGGEEFSRLVCRRCRQKMALPPKDLDLTATAQAATLIDRFRNG